MELCLCLVELRAVEQMPLRTVPDHSHSWEHSWMLQLSEHEPTARRSRARLHREIVLEPNDLGQECYRAEDARGGQRVAVIHACFLRDYVRCEK